MEVIPQHTTQPTDTEKFDKNIIQLSDIKSLSANEKTLIPLTRVLVVEDTRYHSDCHKTLLHEVLMLTLRQTVREAVEMFEPGKYGLVYMDISLPK